MWPVRRVCLVLLLVLQFVRNIDGEDEEGSVGVEGSEIINNVRGDNIVPENDYDYSQFIPIHNDFTDDYDSEDMSGDYEVCDNPICWSSQCEGGENIQCGCCPEKRPVRIRDIDLTVSCSPSGAVVGYNLTNVLGYGLENLTVVISYNKEGEEDIIDSQEVEDFDDTEIFWPGLCSGVSYRFCVEVTHGHMSSLDEEMMCKVSLMWIIR